MRHSTSALRPLAGAPCTAGSAGFASDGATGGAGLPGAACVEAGEGPAADAAARPVSALSSTATTAPSDRVSPTLTFSSLTTPAADEGTSIVALSDSSVTRPWSLATVSPTRTSTSITGTAS